MSISVYKTFSAGEVLTAADLNASFTNFTTNALALISPLTGNLAAGSNKVTGLAAGTTSGDALSYGQALNGTTLTLSGAASVASLTSAGALSGTTLALTGATTGGTTAAYSGAVTVGSMASSGGVSGTTLALTGATTGGTTAAYSGAVTAASLNKVAVTAPAASATLSIADGKTLGYAEEATTWTPVIAGSSAAGTTTYTSRVGHYTEIGNRVFGTCEVTYSAMTGTGSITVSLPTSAASAVSTAAVIGFGYVNTATPFAELVTVQRQAAGGGSTAIFNYKNGTNISTVAASNTTATITFFLNYEK